MKNGRHLPSIFHEFIKETTHMLPVLALLLAAFTWGSAFCFIKQILDTVSPYYLLAFRFSLSAILLCLIFRKKLSQLTRHTFLHGVRLGVILYFEFFFYTIGLQYTTASKSAFICAGYMMIMPLVYFCIVRKRPTVYEIMASFLCMTGLTCILCSDLSSLNIGDAISSLTAVCYAIHIVYTGIYAKDDDPVLLNILQIGAAALLAAAVAFLSGPFPGALPSDAISGILYLAVMCTIIPYLLSVYGQRYVKTSTSGILLSFESVFGAALSILVLDEPFTPLFALGTILVVGSAVLSEQGTAT